MLPTRQKNSQSKLGRAYRFADSLTDVSAQRMLREGSGTSAGDLAQLFRGAQLADHVLQSSRWIGLHPDHVGGMVPGGFLPGGQCTNEGLGPGSAVTKPWRPNWEAFKAVVQEGLYVFRHADV